MVMLKYIIIIKMSRKKNIGGKLIFLKIDKGEKVCIE